MQEDAALTENKLARLLRLYPCNLAAIFLVLLMGTSNLQYLNHCLNRSPAEETTVRVVSMDSRRSRRHRSYSCTVLLPDGSEKTFRISGLDYEEPEIGDYILLVERSGGLSLSYSYPEIPQEDSV